MRALRAQLWDRLRLNFFVYPGVVRFRAADCLMPYYRWRQSRLTSLQIIVNAIVWACFQVWLPGRARSVARHWGKDRSWQQFARRTGREWMVDPEDLATFAIERPDDLRFYMRRMDQIQVVRTIEGPATDHSPGLIEKDLFQSRCDAAGLPVPGLLATIDAGRALIHANEPLPRSAIVKPVRESGGKGILAIDGFDIASLREFATRLSRGRYVVQERLQPHPALAGLALHALPTLRVTTMLDERDQPEVVHAALRFAAAPEAFVDNGHAGGLVGPVDMAAGVLRAGISGWRPGRYAVHPATGAPIEGVALPDWQEALALAREAHAKMFAPHVIIGWDIGLSDHGPALVEANQRPAARLTQRSAGIGIGATRYGELIEHHLRRAIETGRNNPRKLSTG